MLHRFWTYEEAAIFVSRKRSEGYYADILHENVSALWGPVAMMGVSAWVSEEALEDGEEAPDLERRGLCLPPEFSVTVGLAVLALSSIVITLFLYGWLRELVAYPAESFYGFVDLLSALLVAVCCVMTAWISSRWLHALWDQSHRFHEQASLAHLIIAVFLIFIATDLGAWVLFALVEFASQ